MSVEAYVSNVLSTKDPQPDTLLALLMPYLAEKLTKAQAPLQVQELTLLLRCNDLAVVTKAADSLVADSNRRWQGSLQDREQFTRDVAEAGGISSLVMLLRSSSVQAQVQAATLLGFMLNDPTNNVYAKCCKDALCKTGATPFLIAQLRSSEPRLRHAGAAAICNLTFQGNAKIGQQLVASSGIPLLIILSRSSNEPQETKQLTGNAFLNIATYCAGSGDRAELVAVRHAVASMDGGIQLLLDYLTRSSAATIASGEEEQQEAARAFANLAQERELRPTLQKAGVDAQLQRLVEDDGAAAAVKQAALAALAAFAHEDGAATKCRGCGQRPPEMVWVPCGHMCLCQLCGFGSGSCPVCSAQGHGMRLQRA